MTTSRFQSSQFPAIGILVLGLALQMWLWSRAWIDWDQIVLLKLGMKLVVDGELAIFGKIMSGGGLIPGSFLQLVIAGPLALWFDYRSPGLVVGMGQLLAVLVLWRVVRQGYGDRVAATFLAVYWLSPWRLYHSGFIWEPNYLMLPAALHMWAFWSQREAPKAGASFVLGCVLLLAPQLHASGVVLFLITGLWLLHRPRAVNWAGIVAGAALGAVSLVPTVIGVLRGMWPERTAGVAGTGFVTVFPLLKAAAYWVRLGTLDVGRRVRQIVDPAFFGDAGISVLSVLSAASVLAGVVAAVWYLSRRRVAEASEAGPAEAFFYRYVLLSGLAILISAGLSPVWIQGWHTLVILHAATLPVALWTDRFLWSGATWLRALVVAFVVMRVPIVVAIGLGHPMYIVPHGSEEEMRSVEPANLADIEPRKMPFGSGAGAQPLFRGIDLWE
ncbi:MAG: hypothetical protein VYE73_16185 [Acidobacteriota bacterium]|nr:hypothetical protein [Acidobacteriota bacterium]